jgi:hypothetical protein
MQDKLCQSSQSSPAALTAALPSWLIQAKLVQPLETCSRVHAVHAMIGTSFSTVQNNKWQQAVAWRSRTFEASSALAFAAQQRFRAGPANILYNFWTEGAACDLAAVSLQHAAGPLRALSPTAAGLLREACMIE